MNLQPHRRSGDNLGSTWVYWPEAWVNWRMKARSLRVPGIAVEQSRTSIMFICNAAVVSGKCSYYLLFNDVQNS